MSFLGLGKPNVDKMKAKRDIKGLTKALSYSDPEIRSAAVTALGDINDIQGLNALITCLKDSEKKIRKKAINIMKDRRDVNGLTRALSNDDFEVRLEAVTALGEIGGSQVLDPLVACLKDARKEIRKKAINLLSAYEEPCVKKGLATVLLEDSSKELRIDAIKRLSKMGGEDIVDALSEALWKEEDEAILKLIMDSLGEIQTDDTLAVLANSLKDYRPHVVSYVIAVLKKINNPRLPDIIIKCTQNSEEVGVFLSKADLLATFHNYAKSIECTYRAFGVDQNREALERIKHNLNASIPEDQKAWFILGAYWLENKRYQLYPKVYSEHAAAHFDNAIKNDSPSEEIRYNIAKMWLESGKTLLKFKDSASTTNALANFDRAVTCLDEILNTNPNDQTALELRQSTLAVSQPEREHLERMERINKHFGISAQGSDGSTAQRNEVSTAQGNDGAALIILSPNYGHISQQTLKTIAQNKAAMVRSRFGDEIRDISAAVFTDNGNVVLTIKTRTTNNVWEIKQYADNCLANPF